MVSKSCFQCLLKRGCDSSNTSTLEAVELAVFFYITAGRRFQLVQPVRWTPEGIEKKSTKTNKNLQQCQRIEEEERSSMQHSQGTIQRLTAGREKWRESFFFFLQDAIRRTERPRTDLWIDGLRIYFIFLPSALGMGRERLWRNLGHTCSHLKLYRFYFLNSELLQHPKALAIFYFITRSIFFSNCFKLNIGEKKSIRLIFHIVLEICFSGSILNVCSSISLLYFRKSLYV